MDNVDVIRRLEGAWVASDYDTVAELLAAGFVSHSAVPGMPADLEGFKMAHELTMQAFPDRKMAIEDIFGAGDRVVVRCRVTGTNSGPAAWLGINEPTGRPFDIESISIYRVADGKAAEHWALNDGMGLMFQLGALSPPA